MQLLGERSPSAYAQRAGHAFLTGSVARRIELALLSCGALAASWWLVGWDRTPLVAGSLLGLVPAVVALQYGLSPALLTSALTLLAARVAPSHEARDVLLSALIAPLALSLVIGHLRDRAESARRALESQLLEQQRKLEQLFRAHGVLRASHGQLEERLAAREWSLEAAVREAERQIGARDLAGASGALLELLAAQGRVSASAVYLARGGLLPASPDAKLGAAGPAHGSDRLVQRAFATGEVVSVESQAASKEAAAGEVLVALPVVTTTGWVAGVVAVHDLPFVAFHEAHFRLLATLIAPFTDALARKASVAEHAEPRTPALPPPVKALARMRELERTPREDGAREVRA